LDLLGEMVLRFRVQTKAMQKNIRLHLGLTSLLFALSGCRTPTVTYEQLQTLSISRNANSFPFTEAFYCGSRGDWDYFRLDPLGGFYRVSSVESPVSSKFPYSKNRNKWQNWPIYPELKTIPSDLVPSVPTNELQDVK
jgi:hypothetical protein